MIFEPLQAGWDGAVFHILNRDRGIVLDALFTAASSRQFGVGAMVAFSLIALAAGVRRFGVSVLGIWLAVALSDRIGAWLLKPIFARTRPCYALQEGSFRLLGTIGRSGAFPSLHAANAFAFAYVARQAFPGASIPLYLLATLVAVSRIYLGVHWPTDVLAGMVWGTLCGALSSNILERWSSR